jgi:hypothetical protein
MDWNRFIVIAAQVVVVIVLGTLVALGKDSAVTDGLLAVSGSLTGIAIVQKIAAKTKV